MKLLIVRHGIAEDADGKSDAKRSLTNGGRKRLRSGARALRDIVPHLDLLASSPLSRAMETAEVLAEEYDGVTPAVIAPLAPGKTPIALLHWLQKQKSDATIALVGHEPGLGVFISWMLTGLQESIVILKKGSACLLEVEGEIRAGRARMHWLLKPSQLRKLGAR